MMLHLHQPQLISPPTMHAAVGISILQLYYISGSVTYYISVTSNADELVFDLDNALITDSVLFRENNISISQQTDKTLHLFFLKRYPPARAILLLFTMVVRLPTMGLAASQGACTIALFLYSGH